MVINIKKYFYVWLRFAINGFQTQTQARFAMAIFLIGKLLRFFVFGAFMVILVKQTKILAGYNLDQTIFFFLSFNLVDILSQLTFREVYRFRQTVVMGTFDFYLVKPINALFRALFGGPDLIDFLTLLPLLGAIIFLMIRLNIGTVSSVLLYILLIGASLLIALSFHILVLSLAVVTTEIDHAIMMYRDIVGMGRFPIDIYSEPLRGFLTFIIPVGIMMSFPAKSLLGLLSPALIAYSVIFALVLLYLSLRVWNLSLRQYSSASS
ncbi:ABC-2 family transporter protein [Candidatus Daviesbacteria bacterium]|nr:ABC-2 family transporter protein [Candidatus Daviesbacteria bacterium]